MYDTQYNLNLDIKLDKLNDNFKKHLDITTKGFFIFLLTYAFKNEDKIKEYLDIESKAGPQFRSETDVQLNDYITILMAKFLSNKNHSMDDLYKERINYKDVLNEMVKYANAAGIYLINNDLNSWKTSVNENRIYEFMYDVFLIIKEFNDEVPF